MAEGGDTVDSAAVPAPPGTGAGRAMPAPPGTGAGRAVPATGVAGMGLGVTAGLLVPATVGVVGSGFGVATGVAGSDRAGTAGAADGDPAALAPPVGVEVTSRDGTAGAGEDAAGRATTAGAEVEVEAAAGAGAGAGVGTEAGVGLPRLGAAGGLMGKGGRVLQSRAHNPSKRTARPTIAATGAATDTAKTQQQMQRQTQRQEHGNMLQCVIAAKDTTTSTATGHTRTAHQQCKPAQVVKPSLTTTWCPFPHSKSTPPPPR
jgi:hypothetical protein